MASECSGLYCPRRGGSCRSLEEAYASELLFLLQDVSKKNERSALNEVHLVVMRLLSVFMSRTKSGSKSSICEVFVL